MKLSYEEAVQQVFDRLPMFSRIGTSAVKKGLKNITALCELLGNPQDKIKTIHIAGTNGKGSTSHIIAAALQQSGYKVGLYTSPHLVDVRERVRINGVMISKERFVAFVEIIQPHIETIAPSYFEVLVALAFYCFYEEKVDVAVIETGLGGRLDSTNIITPELSVITSIALDHTDILGDTLEEIAVEKAGIIKSGVPVVIGKTQAETESVFVQKSIFSKSSILFSDTIFDLVADSSHDDHAYQHFKMIHLGEHTITPIHTDLLGYYQRANIITALGAVLMLERSGWHTSVTQLIAALPQVKVLTGLRGRWDFYHKNVVLDVGHNPDGITQIKQQLTKTPFKHLHIVYGSVKDKDVRSSVALLSELDATLYLTQALVPRAMPVADLETFFKENNHSSFQSFDNVTKAVEAARSSMHEDDLLLITGSFFVVGEAYEYLEKVD